MVNSWFTSDFHFGHRNIIQYCNRPFASTGEMDAAILSNLNRKVGEDDQLFFLGDFCIGGPEKARQYRDRIVCRNVHFVEGNHDRALRDLKGAFCKLESVGRDPNRRTGNRTLPLRYACLASFFAWRLASLRSFSRQPQRRSDVAVHRCRRGLA